MTSRKYGDSKLRFASAIKANYTRLDGKALRERFPMMQFDLSCHGVHEDDGGVLRADKCLASLQVYENPYI